jgi:hypothetical protein
LREKQFGLELNVSSSDLGFDYVTMSFYSELLPFFNFNKYQEYLYKAKSRKKLKFSYQKTTT